MRLWQPELLQALPQELLCALHRDICLMRSSAWKAPRHAGSWAYNLPWGCIAWYHSRVMKEMQRRGWTPSRQWFDPCYRGRHREPVEEALVDAEDKSPAQWRMMFRKACLEPIAAQQAAIRDWEASHASK